MDVLAGRSAREKAWLVAGVLVGMLLLLLGYLLLIGPQRSQTSDVDAQADLARNQNTSLSAHIDTLRAENENVATYRRRLVAARQALPATSGLPDFLRTLQSLGTSTHTNAVDLTVGPPTDVSEIADGAVTPGAGATAPATTSTPTSTPTSSSSTGSTPSTTAGDPAGVATPATGTVYGLTITAQVNGSTDALDRFLQQLQAVQPRAVLITQLTEGSVETAGTAGAPSSGSTLQLTMLAFVAPGSADEGAALAAAAH